VATRIIFIRTGPLLARRTALWMNGTDVWRSRSTSAANTEVLTLL
jgi:hypothetical protein